MPRIILPPTLRSTAFRTRDAHGHGIGEGRLRGADLLRPFHGIRVEASAEESLGRHRACAPLLREGERFSHTSAAELWNLPLPPGDHPIHLTVRPPRNATRTTGVQGHVSAWGAQVLRDGLPVSDPATLFCECASLLSLPDLVALGDAIVLDPVVLDPGEVRPHLALAELRTAVRAFRGRGCRRSRAAIALVRQGAESRPETLLRVLLVGAGLPEPKVNAEVRSRAGRILGRADLVYREARVIVEYDGDQHRTSTRQYEIDMTRIDGFVADEWRVIRVRSRGLFATPDATVDRVRSALRLPESTFARR
ncbi:endonuclease domain-containing protein [Lysinimonas soli]|uniref:Endonuclease domain-containing protein n=1 Tax=Lysinimonas soli TaxID=1074233 RepID=A0ABW0NQ84_9MICO